MRSLHKAIFLLVFVFTSANAVFAAQVADKTVIVDKIAIDYGKLDNINEALVLSHIMLKEGMAFDQLQVDRSVRSLYGTGLFDYIQAQVTDLSPGKVKITFSLQCRYRVQSLTINGNDNFSRKKIVKKSEARIVQGSVLDEMTVRKACDKIKDFYVSKGYAHVKADYKITRNDETGMGNIVINIEEGPKLKIKNIKFEGVEKVDDDDLRDEMTTCPYKWWWSWLSGSGRLEEEKLEEDLDKIRTFYIDKGYLDVEVSEDNVKIEETSSGKIYITISIKEGRQYFVGDINFEGEEALDELTISRVLSMTPGDPFSPKSLDDDIKNIEDLYGSIGRLEASVQANRVANIDTGNIDIVYQINEGDEYKIETIKISGNDKTITTVILRELAMRPGQIFNTMWMKASESRLKNTRFFDDVTVTPEATNIPGKKNMKITVHEAPTATFQIGIGFSTTESGTVYAQYTQGNFDLFNWRSFFQGAGQKFQISVSMGTSSNSSMISFEEPYFMQQHLGLGFELYYKEILYDSDYYDTVRFGSDVYIRKRLFGVWEGKLMYTIESVDVTLATVSVSDLFDAEQGSRLVSKVSFILQRDTRNDLLFTTNGSRVSFTTEVAGLGGDTKYVKLEARAALFLPTFEAGEQSVSFLARGGTAWALDGGLVVNDVNYGLPMFDRFFLGGSQSLRGFEYKEVGPRDPDVDETIGGNTYGFSSIEYTIKLAEQFRFALFYDWGFVNINSADFDPVSFNDDWGVGIRMLVMNNPLSLDYALPINHDDENDQGGQFNFSFGTRF